MSCGDFIHHMVLLLCFNRDRNCLKKFRSRTLGRGEEPLLSSGWTLIGSELSSPNFNSVRAERSFAIRYLNVVRYLPKLLLSVAEFCSRAFGSRSRPKVKDAFLDRAFRSRPCAI